MLVYILVQCSVLMVVPPAPPSPPVAVHTMGNTTHTHRYADIAVMNTLTTVWLRINMMRMIMIVMVRIHVMMVLKMKMMAILKLNTILMQRMNTVMTL